MIWGLSLEPGHEYTTTSPEEVHLSLAAIESRTDFGKAGSYSQLVLKTGDAEQLLCTLVHGTIFQQCLDLKLMAGEEVTFTVQGSFGVFVTGYSYKSPASEVSTGGSESTNNRKTVTYTREPHVEVEPQSDDEHVSGPPVGDTMNGGSDTTAAYREHGDGEKMEESDEEQEERSSQGDQEGSDMDDRPTPAHRTTLPHPVISPKTAGSGGYGTRNRTLAQRTQRSSGSPAPTAHDVAKSSTQMLEEPAALNLCDRSRATASAAASEPLRMGAGTSSTQEDIMRAPSLEQVAKRLANHREPTVVPAAGVSPSPKQQQAPPDDKFTCPLCHEVFPGKDSLLAHEQKHAQEGEMFSCRYCHMVFVQKGNRNIHERIHSAMRHNIRTAFKAQAAAEAKEIKQLPSPTLDEVMQENRSDGSDESPITPSQSVPSQSVPQQSAYINKAPSSREPVRPRPYPNYSGLSLRTQGEEEKNYKCQFCDKPFKRNYDRNRHERIHTGQKPYECAYCELAFSRREHCKKHEVTHLKSPGSQPTEDDPSESYEESVSEERPHE